MPGIEGRGVPDWELHLRPSLVFSGLILVSHLSLLVAIAQFHPLWWWLMPAVLIMAVFNLLKYGTLSLPRSVVKLIHRRQKWYLGLRNGDRLGPFQLTQDTHLNWGWLRLSLTKPKDLIATHILLTPSMVGVNNFRKLQVLVRWCPPASSSG